MWSECSQLLCCAIRLFFLTFYESFIAWGLIHETRQKNAIWSVFDARSSSETGLLFSLRSLWFASFLFASHTFRSNFKFYFFWIAFYDSYWFSRVFHLYRRRFVLDWTMEIMVRLRQRFISVIFTVHIIAFGDFICYKKEEVMFGCRQYHLHHRLSTTSWWIKEWKNVRRERMKDARSNAE